MQQEHVEIDYKDKCKCESPRGIVVNHSLMWHDGDIICSECRKFIRYFDAG